MRRPIATTGETGGAARIRGPRLPREQIRAAAEAEEALTGEAAGIRSVYRSLGSRGSFTTVVSVLREMQREREAAEALVTATDYEVLAQAESLSSQTARREGGEVSSPGEGDQTTGIEKLIYDVSLLRKHLRGLTLAVRKLQDRFDLLDTTGLGAGEKAISATIEAQVGDRRRGGTSEDPASEEYQPPFLTPKEKSIFLAHTIRMIKAKSGALGKHELYANIHRTWQERMSERRVYDFAKARARIGLTLAHQEGKFRLGPDAEVFLSSLKSKDKKIMREH